MRDSDANEPNYCAELLRRGDEDRFLAAAYADPEDRRALIALYAFHVEISAIPLRVKEALIGEIRLQWWRDALAEIRAGKPPRAHPVLEELVAAGVVTAVDEALLIETIDAQSRRIHGDLFSDIDDLAHWLASAIGAVEVAALRLLGGAMDETAFREAHAALAIAREPSAGGAALREEALTWSREAYERSRPAIAGLGARAFPAAAPISLTPRYLAVRGRPFPVAKRVTLFIAAACGRV